MRRFVKAFVSVLLVGIVSVAVIKYAISRQKNNYTQLGRIANGEGFGHFEDIESDAGYYDKTDNKRFGANKDRPWNSPGENFAKNKDNFPVKSDKNYRGYSFELSRETEKERITLKERIVHFDLKGAPPTVAYFVELFPVLASLGATGILLEYEDMFPYADRLKLLRSGYAYSAKDVQTIIAAAKQSGLEIIPLIQTFGHLEFLLKHAVFADLREVEKYPQVICPNRPKTATILHEMIDQVVALHTGQIKRIHIGADEAYYVGQCERCKRKLKELSDSKDRLMAEHVVAVANYVKKRHHLNVLMWNDMFQETPEALLSEYNLGSLVQPVIWGYATDLIYNDYFPPGVFDRFGRSFDSVWIASAYKGANGPAQTFVDIDRYLQNHMSWLSLLKVARKDLRNVQGIILTGWQRFDHFGVLCELLPVAMPSLTINLLAMKAGRYDRSVKEDALNSLKCVAEDVFEISSREGSIDSTWTRCSFPGASIIPLINRLESIRANFSAMLSSSSTNGWLTAYNLRHGYGQVFVAEKALNRTEILVGDLEALAQELRAELSQLYFPETVSEWLEQNVEIDLTKLRQFARDVSPIARSGSFPNRPLAALSANKDRFSDL